MISLVRSIHSHNFCLIVAAVKTRHFFKRSRNCSLISLVRSINSHNSCLISAASENCHFSKRLRNSFFFKRIIFNVNSLVKLLLVKLSIIGKVTLKVEETPSVS